jgi:hypothetical protein
MTHVTTLPAASVSKEQLRVILAAHLALDRARIFRRLFVIRFGLLASASVVLALIAPGLSAMARWLPPILFLTPPTWAWIVELRLARHLARQLDGVRGIATHELG